MGRTAKDSFKIGSHRPPNCRPGCNQRKQIIADFIKQNYPPEETRADLLYCHQTVNIE